MSLLTWVYAVAIVGMALYGFNLILMAVLAMWAWRCERPTAPPSLSEWPSVLVQLPVYNERYVVERVIDAAVALDYPADRLTIQVLDDSTDDTPALARARVAYHRLHGKPVVYHHRTHRNDFKAGALAEGLCAAPGEFVAVFDADFLPPPDFLRRVLPAFAGDPRLGMVQARWDHLNPEQNALARAEALAFDSYFTVEQVARSRSGLLLNFNGSAGVWRRGCIADAGGWQGDTLAEDLDLSYRAQLKGWCMDYLPQVAAPAELPASVIAFKRQQFRWAKGSFQVLGKLGPQLLASRLSLFQKVQGILHLAGYLPHALMLLSLLLSLPVVLVHGHTPLNWQLLGLAGFGPPLVAVLGQLVLRRGWKRLLYYPVLIMVGIGLALTNAHALWSALFGRANQFLRTPKLSNTQPHASAYALALDWTTWGELLLAMYALATGLLAVERAPGLAPFIFLYALGFGYTAVLGFLESGGLRAMEWQVPASRDK